MIVVQESWTPDDGTAAVARVRRRARRARCSSCRFGRARSSPGRTSRATATARARSGSRSSAASRPTRVGRAPGRHRARRPHARARRRCTWSSTSTARPVDLVGVHLTSRLPYGPPIQLRRLAAAAARRLAGPRSSPATATSGARACSTFLPGWRRAVRGRTWPASRPHSQIDHILVRADDRRRRQRGARPTSAPTTGRCGRRCASA